MEIGDPHGVDRALHAHCRSTIEIGVRVVRVAEGAGIIEVEDRLGDTEEQDANADTGREQHREPGEITELRTRVVIAQSDRTVLRAHQVETNKQHDDCCKNIVPAQCRFDPSADRGIDSIGELDIQHGKDHERQDHALGGEAHPGMQAFHRARAGDQLVRVWRAVHLASLALGHRTRINLGQGRQIQLVSR